MGVVVRVSVVVMLLRVKVAVTALCAVIVTRQLLVPLHAPDQPAKVEPLSATAVRVTTVL